MKKILCVFLSILMCASLLTVFASCGKKAQDIDLNQCQIVTADGLSGLASREINNMRKIIADKTGVSLKFNNESKAAEGETTYEILVGKTGRPETEKALKALKNTEGFTIQVIKNKVVIVGTNDALTYLALQTFEEKYLSGETVSATLSLESKYVKNDCVLLTLLSGGKSDYTIIYSKKWDTTSDANYMDRSVVPVEGKLDVVDYQYKQIANFMLNFCKSADLKKIDSQSEKKEVLEKEIIIGTTEREETAIALSKITQNEYIITTVNGKIVVAAWNDQGVQLAVEKLTQIMQDCITQSDSGKVAIYPADLTYIGKFSPAWPTDFPKPEGANLYGTCDVEDGHVEYCYTGNGVTAAAFDAYSAKLKEAGYKVFQDNTIEDSRYTTFTNDTYMLHVIYAAYKNKNNFDSFTPTLRVVAAKMTSVNLPVENSASQLKYTKVFTDDNVGADTGALITQMYLSYEESNIFGNCYVTMLEDGSFILYDGGGNGYSSNGSDVLEDGTVLNPLGNPVAKTDEAQRLYSLMRDLMNLVGKTGPVVISAWLMSHSHWDHMTCFKDFCKDRKTSVTVENAYANFASNYETFNSYNPGNYRAAELMTSLDFVNGDGKYIKVHSGQTFWVRNAEVEVLYTHEDQFPEIIRYFNDTSTIFRIKYHVTDGKGNITDGENGPVTGMWLGDLWQNGSAIMSAMYGDYLKSDMVQVAHHGYNGCLKQIYMQIAPTLVWWPTCGQQFVEQAYVRTTGGYEVDVDRYIAQKLSSVKWILVAGGITGIGTGGYDKDTMFSKDPVTNKFYYEKFRHNYTLKITKNGFDGDKLYYADENFAGVGGDRFTGAAPVSKITASN